MMNPIDMTLDTPQRRDWVRRMRIGIACKFPGLCGWFGLHCSTCKAWRSR
jgi:hypothetical protein